MKVSHKFLTLIGLVFLAFSCEPKDEIAEKRAQLEDLKSQSNELTTSIAELEAELMKLDPDFAKQNQKSILITTSKVRKGEFDHYVEVTGSVLSKKNVVISAETAGRILEVPVLEGMRVTKGTVLARIDAESIERSIDELENSLDLAKTLFEKQERLWKQQIGTEVQYLEAKNRKEGLERSLASARTNLDKAIIRAPFSGTIESVEVRLGELVQPGMGMFQFVGESDLFIEADISESYIGVLSKGDSVDVNFPSINEEIQTRVSSVGAIINPNNRTFKVEVYLPNMSLVKPNMITVLKILDYQSTDAVIVPSYLILSDNRGDYVFIVEGGKALKKYVERGKTFDKETEILTGLNGTETLVDKGFREVGDNFNVTIAEQ
ncbi:efflux RND transporter periplasmic adaptor subunit [Algoriphagus sp.]|uniref:efflux RND transporter periplasmic adaptor subunit n=1 Tax=Algoriphagus sp. TaxID=1872435 RepID=UPI0025FA1D45|nr:efflux RND transporter periplasmic adaptor subunit [Algoriphagus sp.]